MTAPEGGPAAVTTGPAPWASTGGGGAPPPADDRFRDALSACLAPALVLERELAGGGMARVFVAQEAALGRRVVVKVLPPDLAAGVNRERFRREVQLAAQLQHPHIVPLLAAGEVAAAGPDARTAAAAGSLYYTMPFIEGESLRAEAAARAARGAGFTPREVARLLHDVAEALGYAHARGVVHRDVKPGNVLLQHGHALVTDFGVAKALGGGAGAGPGAMTTVGMAIGTPAYMAPEQLAADPAADHRVDLYAAGLVAYELLTGASPFAAASPQATLAAQLTRDPAPLAALRPDVPPALAAAVTACLAKDPAARPPSAEALLALLDGAPPDPAARDRTTAPVLAGSTAPAGATAPTPALTADVPATAAVPGRPARAPRRPLAVAAGALALAAVAAGAGWLGLGGGAHARSDAAGAGRPGAARPAAATASAGATPAATPGVSPGAGVGPTLSHADSVAIAAAVAREFERALARQRRGTGAPLAAGAVASAGASADAGVPRPAQPVPPPPPVAAARRAARDAVADSLARLGVWGDVSREVVRAVVGRLPAGAQLPPEARRDLDASLRELRELRDARERAHPGIAFPSPAPAGPGGDDLLVVLGGRYRGFAAVAATEGPPSPGERRVALVGLHDATNRPDLARLTRLVEQALRGELAQAGRYALTGPAVAAVARRERVPDPVVAGATGAGAVVRGALSAADDGRAVTLTLLAFDARRGALGPVRASTSVAPDAQLPAVAATLAADARRELTPVLAGVAWGAGR